MINRFIVNGYKLPGFRFLLVFFAILFSFTASYGQKNQAYWPLDGSRTISRDSAFASQKIALPAALIGYGLIAIDNELLMHYNWEAKKAVNRRFTESFKNDNLAQYIPLSSVHVLNAVGIKGKHDLKDRTIIMATSYLVMSSAVIFLKNTTGEERPDSQSKKSFPSGHTATAFMGAEFLYQEFKDISPWYGIAGYVIASGTGLYRMVNNRHWLSDVIGGAGVGILSAKFAFWLQPYLREYIFPEKGPVSGLVTPIVSKEHCGLSLNFFF